MSKYDIIKTSKLKFARFGGLSSVKQEGYKAKAETFHSPPASRGFYAFVWPYYEMFLLGGYANVVWKSGSKFTYARGKDGEIIDNNHSEYEKITAKENCGYWSVQTKAFSEHRKNWPDYDDEDYDAKATALEKDWEDNYKGVAKWVLVEKPSPRIFEFAGNLWHHLGNNLKPGQELGQHGSWTKSSVGDYRVALEKEMHTSRAEEASQFVKMGMAAPSTRSPFRFWCKDRLEVFVEKL